MGSIEEQRIDELLELIWTMEEEGNRVMEDIVDRSDDDMARSVLEKMENDTIYIAGKEVKFTKKGKKIAESIIRRHRLAERLLSEVFELESKNVHQEACKFEHILSPEVTDSVCTFLGHPPVCPHGKPIPRGVCCARFKKEVKPLVVSIKDLEPGDEGRIVFITPKEHARLDRLGSLGIIPGSTIRLHQKSPTYVIKIGETDLALDREIAKEIYVKKIGG